MVWKSLTIKVKGEKTEIESFLINVGQELNYTVIATSPIIFDEKKSEHHIFINLLPKTLETQTRA